MSPAELVLGCSQSAPKDWNAYLGDHSPGSLWQRAEWGRAIAQRFGHKPHYITARRPDGHLCGVLSLIEQSSLLFGRRLSSVPYFNYGGPVADSTAIAQQLVDEACALAKKRRVRSLELRQTTPIGAGLETRDDKLTMVLPLADNSDSQWRGLRSKLRSQIRRPQKAGARSVVGGKALLDDFYRVFALNMRDLGVPVYPRDFFEMVFDHSDAQIIVVYMDEQPVAAGFLVQDGNRMEIPWASSVREYNRFSPNMLMYWECLEQSIKRGCLEFDFGRCTRGSGTHRFKAQWGAEERPFHWEYFYPTGRAVRPPNPDQSLFRMAMAIWRRVPLAICGWIGPRIVMDLP